MYKRSKWLGLSHKALWSSLQRDHERPSPLKERKSRTKERGQDLVQCAAATHKPLSFLILALRTKESNATSS